MNSAPISGLDEIPRPHSPGACPRGGFLNFIIAESNGKSRLDHRRVYVGLTDPAAYQKATIPVFAMGPAAGPAAGSKSGKMARRFAAACPFLPAISAADLAKFRCINALKPETLPVRFQAIAIDSPERARKHLACDS